MILPCFVPEKWTNAPFLVRTDTPTFTRACVFCAGRVKQGLAPACAAHCMANILQFGKIEDLKEMLPKKRKAILWTRG
jgi:Fe-S-cluster-containing dehydrogenase component